jgi:hypothetical protein
VLIELDATDDLVLTADDAVPSRIVTSLESRGIRLSPGARLAHGGTRDIKWRIVDEGSGQTFVLRRDDGRLKIYQPLVEWKNPLRKLPSPLELALAAGLERGVRALGRVSRSADRHCETARNSWRVAEAMAAADGAGNVIDSSKSAVRLKLLYIVRPRNVRVVHLVRDGRAVAASAMRRKAMTAETAARVWKRENQHLALVLRGIPAGQKHRVRYEDLCENPARELARICDFLGLHYESGMPRLWQRPVHNIPGNPMLFEKSRRAITRDDRWRRDLSAPEVSAIERIAGRLNRSLGYV